MKFRSKILSLPLSAAVIFVIGIGVSYWVGARTSASLSQLRQVDYPYLDQVRKVEARVEQFRLLLQSAVAEGEIERVKDVQALVDKVHESFALMEKIDGKGPSAEQIRATFDGYSQHAIAATRAVLEHKDPGDSVVRMQHTQAELIQILEGQRNKAEQATVAQQANAAFGVQLSSLIILGTGVAVLLTLGMTSVQVVRVVWRDLGAEPSDLRQAMARIAAGDLTTMSELPQASDERSLNAAIVLMTSRLREAIDTVRQSAQMIAEASQEIAMGNQDLSHRTEISAQNLQKTASSMADLTEIVKNNAEASDEASAMAHAASTSARRGEQIVDEVVASMEAIHVSSKKISDITAVIDSLAFQTNILALNAAVESARAGEHGRGFAVVAGEVRTLAQRSAQAAREIKTLIGDSRQRVDNGTTLAQAAGSAIRDMVSDVQRVTDVISGISSASLQQSNNISLINITIMQLDSMTQQNAALVEEAASAAESMQNQAVTLANTVAEFRAS